MKSAAQYAVLCLFVLAAQGACTIHKPVPLDEGFWHDTQPVVGVVLAAVPDPEVSVKIFSTTPFARSRTLIMSHRYDQDFDAEPSILTDQRRLWHYLSSHETGALAGLKDVFTQGLASRGFHAAEVEGSLDEDLLPRYTPPSSGYARNDYRALVQAGEFDLLIVLHIRKYGSYCGYLDQRNISTGIMAAVEAMMVDTATNRILWQNAHRISRQCRNASSGCDAPGTYGEILRELDSVLAQAAQILADDLFSGAPK